MTEQVIGAAIEGLRVPSAFQLDLRIEDWAAAESKAVEQALPIHPAQWLTCWKAANLRIGLRIHFTVPILKKGLQRMANDFSSSLRALGDLCVSAVQGRA